MTTDLQKMQISLGDMHTLASTSLNRIQGTAKCALRSLETPDGARDLEAMAQALESIINDAALTNLDLEAEAESHGIETIDKEQQRRMAARDALRQSLTPV